MPKEIEGPKEVGSWFVWAYWAFNESIHQHHSYYTKLEYSNQINHYIHIIACLGFFIFNMWKL